MKHWHGKSLSSTPWVATLGIFDGVHQGHQQLLKETVGDARARQFPNLLITFDPHPGTLLCPAQPPQLLTTLDQRLTIVEHQGIDNVWIIPFDHALARLSPAAFLQFLSQTLSLKALHVGRAFAFGRDRLGNVDTLAEWGKGVGCQVTGHGFKAFDDERLSSSRIRQSLMAGRIEEAALLLGRPYCLTGQVVPGDKRGRGLGFPTANLRWNQGQLPAAGVYATGVHLPGETALRLGLTNVGKKPTFQGPALTVETHLPGYDGILYERALALFFLHRLRDEKRFSELSTLQKQIGQDVEQGLAWWASHTPAFSPSPWGGTL